MITSKQQCCSDVLYVLHARLMMHARLSEKTQCCRTVDVVDACSQLSEYQLDHWQQQAALKTVLQPRSSTNTYLSGLG